jgi:tRNA (cytosine38-C5)-methyltransferase
MQSGSGPLLLLSGERRIVHERVPKRRDEDAESTSTQPEVSEAPSHEASQEGDRPEPHNTERYSEYHGQTLRFFSPDEIARLLGFPATFSFPRELARRNAYALLGNSLNVLVVSELVRFMLRA